MFTGLVKDIGIVTSAKREGEGYQITVFSKLLAPGVIIDDSIAVNGVCLTVTSNEADHFTVQAISETVIRSNTGSLKTGSKVNLEPALMVGERLGGHIVQGHIDGIGEIYRIIPKQTGSEFWIKTDRLTSDYIVEKGSVCLDGISLTVAEVKADEFRVAVIPHTIRNTTAQFWKCGAKINIETDIIGRYIEKLLKPRTEGVTMEKLTDMGY